jgi:hypothetical protein
MTTMIEETIQRWHLFLKGELPGGLDELLDDDVVFYSPVVFAPQEGKDLTKLYLTAATQVFPGDNEGSSAGSSFEGSSFHYTKQLLDDPHAVLEFETSIKGKYVNGIDMITAGPGGKIVEFKVMIRPLSAINLVREQMMAMLDRLSDS